MALLVIAFLITALLYAMAGFGGGSTYNALLVLNGTDYEILPAIALTCNIIVVSSGVAQFLRARRMRLRDVAPLCILSAPAAWVGGRIQVPEQLFIAMLGASLLVAGIFMFIDAPEPKTLDAQKRPFILPVSIGGAIGFLSGLVGIGGGIFLAPFLHIIRWGRAHEIAGAASFFILINSLTGLAGQVQKLDALSKLDALDAYWPLPVSVLVGGAVGGFLGARKLPAGVIKKITGALILFVAVRLLATLVT
ncbi:MAG: sulfite exporter TauE/SafE family protein [Parvularculaceae bacterium]|nr:sulfite exporter TauE/SafE family protein [Parvularculaceae bacterium]